MNFIVEANNFVNGIVWGWPIIVLIFGAGLFLSIRLGFLQIHNIGFVYRQTIGKAFKKGEDENKRGPGEISSFQAAMVSVSAIVGSGNIAGVATAIVVGGPGAVFWMLIAAFFGMASKFAEIALGIKYREVREDGSVGGGAMYYIAKGLNQKWLAVIFSVLVIFVYFIIACIVDTNTIANAVNERFGTPVIVTGIVLALMTAVVVFGGIKRIGRVCEILSPFMAGGYLLAGIVIILIHITKVPAAVVEIVKGAFTPAGVTGGAIGSIFVVIRYGFARGMFSNEAGMGTAAMVHSGAKVNDPIEQAVWGPVEVFLDTILVCSISAITIVLSGLWADGRLDGAALTMRAFDAMLPGNWGGLICLGAVILFGYSCLISCYTYAERAAEYLFGHQTKYIIRGLWILTIVVGSVTTLGFAWDLADTFNGLMIVPNLITIVILSGQVVKLKKSYFSKELAAEKAVKNK
jgi:AGCS family alanine or glycine:cation symporter